METAVIRACKALTEVEYKCTAHYDHRGICTALLHSTVDACRRLLSRCRHAKQKKKKKKRKCEDKVTHMTRMTKAQKLIRHIGRSKNKTTLKYTVLVSQFTVRTTQPVSWRERWKGCEKQVSTSCTATQ